jgi:hypothetical protein
MGAKRNLFVDAVDTGVGAVPVEAIMGRDCSTGEFMRNNNPYDVPKTEKARDRWLRQAP